MNNISQAQTPNDTIRPLILGQLTKAAKDHRPDPDPDYLVQGLLHPGEVSMFAGPSNLGKSAIVASIAAHIAVGRDIGGRRVSRAAVLYVAAEAPNGILNRAYPYLTKNSAKVAAFDVLDMPVDLSNPTLTKRLALDAVHFKDFHNCDDLLIVIDTLNLCMGDGDENSSRDTGRVLGNVGHLARTTNAHVLIVHHMGASETARPRGSTTLTANVDTGMTLHKADTDQPDGTVFITVHKQREAQKPAPMAFQIRSFAIGENRHGETTTVPWAVPFTPEKSLIEETRTRTNKQAGPTLSDKRRDDLLRVLTALAKKNSKAWHKPKEVGEMTGEPFNGIRSNSDTMRKKVREALDTLLSNRLIEETKEGVRLSSKPPSQSDGSANSPLH